ncbi:MAG: VOC family protein [Thermoplasmata archaeon]
MAKQQRTMAGGPTGLSFNHALIYSRNLGPALRFYRGRLGFTVIDQMSHGGRIVYVRMKASRGTGTLALHLLEPGKELPRGGGVRLYFEVKELEKFCARLRAAGLNFSQLPKMMPWGWKHAYVDDPDGNEVSLYWAGSKRFQKSTMTP